VRRLLAVLLAAAQAGEEVGATLLRAAKLPQPAAADDDTAAVHR